MKKIILVLMLSLFVSACSSTQTTPTESNNTPTDATADPARDAETGLLIDASTGLLTMTLDELAQFDGKDGHFAFVAVEGQVYDVSDDRKWRNGVHEDGIVAGIDATDYMSSSPHGMDILKDFTVIGTLVQ